MTTLQSGARVCAIVGVGPGNGAALAARLAAENYQLALLARSTAVTGPLAASLGAARAYACDVTDPASIATVFEAIRRELGEIDVVVYNAGGGVWGDVEAITAAQFEAAWRCNALGALVVAQQVVPSMKRRGRGHVIFIGATASRRGGAHTAAFAPAKAAQRSLAESMARQLWPAGIHVALVLIDAVVDTPGTRAMMPDQPDGFFMRPADVAEHVVRLIHQPPSAWSFELEIRPPGERW